MNCSCTTPDGQIETYNFSCKAGDTFARGLTITDLITAVPIDITGWTFFMSIYASWAAKQNGDPPLIRLTVGAGFTLIQPLIGELNMLITDTQTATITFPPVTPYDGNTPTNVCVYDFVGVDAAGNEQTEMMGNFTFLERLTVVP